VAESFKVLGQAAIATSAFATTLYTAPTKPDVAFGTRNVSQVLVGSLVVCNRDSSGGAYSVRVIPSGETEGDKHTIFLDKAIEGNTTDIVSLGLCMQSGDTIKVSGATDNTISMSVFGVEMV